VKVENMKQMIQELLGGMEERINARMNANAKANQEDLLARMDVYHEKRMAMFDAYEKRMMAMWNTHPEAMKI
jgi:hypothetical protein